MQLTVREAQDLHELALSCVNSITNMACFMNQVQDAELKSILHKHFPLHIKDYNMKVEYLSKAEGASSEFPVPDLQPILQSFTQSQASPIPVTPRTSVQQFDDREMATAYLLTLKRAGREYAWSAMEMSNPDIRIFLEDVFRMSSRHAYEVWQWMVKKGYYPLEAAPSMTLTTLGNMYQLVREPVPVQ
ncbi:spore coat protein [Paenibacillus sp. TY11]|uniref:spore coat protein n=1 Tax=Paenibacillus sp. TY11 TaxID=3448633 RepID=UPI00403A14AE